jgi:4-amino-4-deoxychorismate lyase
MHKFLSFNFRISTASETSAPVVSDAAFYGRGIFTTLAVYHSKPFQWEKHWRRLTENAAVVGVDLSEFGEENVKNALSEIISCNNLEKGRARITFFREEASGVWQNQAKRRTGLLITTADFRHISDSLRVTVSPYRLNSKSPLVNIKSCNYLENLLVLENAGKNGFDEAIRLNENGEVVSGAMANLFWTFDNKIYTSATETGALCGTTRDFVLERFPVSEKCAALEELLNADEIFLTSAGIGVSRVESLGDRKFASLDCFARIRKLFDEITCKI